ncbi:uroporphyrinogen decarboxylase family protein [Syntrophothermus sp.]|uniref:uroporphyrinogen decarboxylase family protein n=1 Tax=Syntrophothermus sp. TaxID=2736299 RepID=UPI00257F60AF|nr:uroporphyrinogen decarboxylase family protein [Syntrophothermus sp.]
MFKVKRTYRKKLAFYGGVNIQRALPFGTPGEVRGIARKMIREIGRGGRYILSPAHAIPGDVPLENILALLEPIVFQYLE